MEVVGTNSYSGNKEYLSSHSRRHSQEFNFRPSLLLDQEKEQQHKAKQLTTMEIGAYSSSGKEHLSSNPRRRSQQEFGSRPASLLNQEKVPQHKPNQSKVMDSGAYSVSGKEQLFSKSRRRSLQEFDSRSALLLNQKKAEENKANIQSKAAPLNNKSRPVWDCGSSLYDSFELDSFKRQLDSAISCRTMSMPHLSDRRADHRPPPPQPAAATTASNKKWSSNKLSRSLHKFLRSVFKPNSKASSKNNSGVVFRMQEQQSNIKDEFYVVYDKSGALTTIPEVVPHEFDFGSLSPEIGSLVRRTGSERFTTTSTSNIGISCA